MAPKGRHLCERSRHPCGCDGRRAYGLAFSLDTYWFNAILIPFLIMALAGLGLNLLTDLPGLRLSGPVPSWRWARLQPTTSSLEYRPFPAACADWRRGGCWNCRCSIGLRASEFAGSTSQHRRLRPSSFCHGFSIQYGWFSNYATSASISAPKLEIFGFDLSGPEGGMF